MPRVSSVRNGRKLTPEERSRSDHGADGPAMLARASRIIETIDAGVTARQMERAADYPLDRLEEASLLTERQIDALRKLQRLFVRGFGRAKFVQTEAFGIPNDEALLSQAGARREYVDAAHRVPPRSHPALARLMRDEWPGGAEHDLRLIRAGADALADHFGLPAATGMAA